MEWSGLDQVYSNSIQPRPSPSRFAVPRPKMASLSKLHIPPALPIDLTRGRSDPMLSLILSTRAHEERNSGTDVSAALSTTRQYTYTIERARPCPGRAREDGVPPRLMSARRLPPSRRHCSLALWCCCHCSLACQPKRKLPA
jgi:hypothetical protein